MSADTRILPEGSAPRADRTSRALIAAACVAFCALWAWFHGYTVDDTFISMRYARNLAGGYGLVFSTDGSPPVEGYTNFLWVILQTPLYMMRLTDGQILAGVKLLGLAFGLATILATFALTHAFTGQRRAAAVAAGLIALMPYPAFWSAAGLETPLYLFLLTLGLREFVVEGQRGRLRWRSMLVFSLAAMTRPEGLAFALVVMGWELLGIAAGAAAGSRVAPRLRALATGMVVFAVVFGVYFAWRFEFYGHVFPNTYYAKRAPMSLSHVVDRLVEMRVFLRYLIPVVPLAVLGALASGRTRERSLLIVSVLALFAFGFVPDREWMPGYRYELPVLPVLAVFAAIALDRWVFGARPAGWFRRHRWLEAVCAIIVAGYLLSPASGLEKNESYTQRLERAHVALGKWLRRNAPPGASYAGWDMGAVPYYSRFPRIFDIHEEGILCVRTTQEGYDVERFLDREPTFVLLPYVEHPLESVTASSWGPLRFYLNPRFRRTYERLFVLGWLGYPKYALYRRRGTTIDPAALSEAERMVAESFAR